MVIFEDLEAGPNEPSPTQVVASIAVDSAASTQSVLPQAGGSVSATGSDGTVYTLEIPATALVTAIEITMTPITEISTVDSAGQPATWDGAVGVRLEPEGLHLLDTARLRVEPAAQVSNQDWRAVASAAGGADVHLYPLLPDSEAPTLPITHFSEFIVVDGIYLPVEVASSIPVGAQAQLERDIVEWQKDEDATLEDAMAIRDKYWAYVEAILQRSATDCAFAHSGQLARAAGLVKLMSVVGLDAGGDVAAFQDGLSTALENCVRELTEKRCFDRNNGHHVTRLIGLVRMAQLAGGGDELAAILSQAVAGRAAGAALCGDIYGTLVVQESSSSERNGTTYRSRRTIILDIRMTTGSSTDAGLYAGSSFTLSGTSSATGDCYSARGSEFGAGPLLEGSDGEPRLTLETDGSYDLYAPIYSTSRSIVVQDCGNYPIVNESDGDGSAGCGPHGQLVGHREGDVINFSRTYSNPEEGGGSCSVSGSLTAPF